MRKLLKKQGFAPDVLVTDKLRSYGAAKAEIGLSARHERGLRKNNRAENSHQPTRRRERKMQRFQIARISPTLLVCSRRRPKHVQRPTPSHIPPHAPRLPRRSVPDVASRHRGLNLSRDFQYSRSQISSRDSAYETIGGRRPRFGLKDTIRPASLGVRRASIWRISEGIDLPEVLKSKWKWILLARGRGRDTAVRRTGLVASSSRTARAAGIGRARRCRVHSHELSSGHMAGSKPLSRSA